MKSFCRWWCTRSHVVLIRLCKLQLLRQDNVYYLVDSSAPLDDPDILPIKAVVVHSPNLRVYKPILEQQLVDIRTGGQMWSELAWFMPAMDLEETLDMARFYRMDEAQVKKLLLCTGCLWMFGSAAKGCASASGDQAGCTVLLCRPASAMKFMAARRDSSSTLHSVTSRSGGAMQLLPR